MLTRKLRYTGYWRFTRESEAQPLLILGCVFNKWPRCPSEAQIYGGRHILYARRMCSSTYCVSTTWYRVWSLVDTLLWSLVRVVTCIIIVVVRSRTARRVSSMAWSAGSRDRGWFMIRTARNHRLHHKTRMEMASLCAAPTDVLFFMDTSIRGRGVEKQCSSFCKEERRETRLHTPPLILDAVRTK